MNLASRIGAWSKSGGRVPTARDYVQDGLIFQIDGIENAGYGQHDSVSVIDIKGGVQISQQGGAFDVEKDYIHFNGTRYLYFRGTSVVNAIVGKSATIELCAEQLSGNVRNGGVIGFGVDRRMFWEYIQGIPNNNNEIYNRLQEDLSFLTNSVSYETRGGSDQHLCSGAVGEKISLSYTLGEVAKIFRNSVYGIPDFGPGTNAADYDCYIGKIGSYRIGKFKLFSLRVYERLLFQDEIAHNYAIDKARFNLP